MLETINKLIRTSPYLVKEIGWEPIYLETPDLNLDKSAFLMLRNLLPGSLSLSEEFKWTFSLTDNFTCD